MGFDFGDSGLGFGFDFFLNMGLAFKVSVLGCRALGFGVLGLGFGVWGLVLGFWVWCFGFGF